jgi:hypothetical protein
MYIYIYLYIFIYIIFWCCCWEIKLRDNSRRESAFQSVLAEIKQSTEQKKKKLYNCCLNTAKCTLTMRVYIFFSFFFSVKYFCLIYLIVVFVSMFLFSFRFLLYNFSFVLKTYLCSCTLPKWKKKNIIFFFRLMDTRKKRREDKIK